MTKRDEQFLEDAYALGGEAGKKDITGFYKRWAQEYNECMEAGLGYLSPDTLAARLCAHYEPRSGSQGEPQLEPQLESQSDQCIVDIGCGTGLAGKALAALGFTAIDGIDLSPDMLAQAGAIEIYRKLIEADLTAILPVADNTYDAAICTGTFTHGHVDATALEEIVRILRPGGYFAFTVHRHIWQSAGFESTLANLHKRGKLSPLERQAHPLFEAGSDDGWFCVYQKQ